MQAESPSLLSTKIVVRFVTLVFVALLAAVNTAPARAQASDFEHRLGLQMLDIIKEDLKKNYYDPAIGGFDLDKHFGEAGEKVRQAKSVSEILSIIARAVTDIDDSHTFFIPPTLTTRVNYGWQMQMIGDKCFVVAIRPGSDAEAKGLKVGDQVLSVEGYKPLRGELWKLRYFYRVMPRVGMQVLVESPEGQKRKLDLLAKIEPDPRMLSTSNYDFMINTTRQNETDSRVHTHRYTEAGDLLIWKMTSFDLEESQVDEMMSKVKKHKSLILDLRGNGGGLETTLLRLVGHFFDRDIKIGDIKERKAGKPLLAKTRGPNAFKGDLVVIIDSDTGSAAELFARLMQIEKRGTVIGDQSAGAVMRSRFFRHESGTSKIITYGSFIAVSDIVMTDGQSLEKVGVGPDESVLPTGKDLAAQRDPVLSRAALLLKFDLTPERAGALFPVEWAR